MFRVNKDGTHLFPGDCHASQGDGECNGMGAIEIAATLTVKVSLEKAPRRLNHPRIETATHICTLGCARPLRSECNGMGAIEIAATLTVKVSLEKAPRRLNHPRIETATHICTLGCARPLED